MTHLVHLLAFGLLLPIMAVRASAQDAAPARDALSIGLALRGGMPVGFGGIHTDCECTYEHGLSGWNGAIEASAAYLLSNILDVELRVGGQVASAGYLEPWAGELYSTDGVRHPIETEKTMRIRSSDLTATLLLRARLPLAGMTLSLGPRLLYSVDATIDEAETILTPGVRFLSSGSAYLQRYDGPAAGVMRLRRAVAGAVLIAAWDVPLAPGLHVSPEVAWSMTLTPLLPDAPAWKPALVTLGAQFRYALP